LFTIGCDELSKDDAELERMARTAGTLSIAHRSQSRK